MSEYVTVAEIARMYDISPRAVRDWVQRGKLEAVGSWQIDGKGREVEHFLLSDAESVRNPVQNNADFKILKINAEGNEDNFNGALRYIKDLEDRLRFYGEDPSVSHYWDLYGVDHECDCEMD